MRVPWTARKSNQSILKEISPEHSLGGPMLKLKLQYFGYDMKNWLIGKDPDARKDWKREEKGMTEDEMAGWHHWLDGHESEQAPGAGDGQGSLVCCSPRGHKESDTTEWLNWTELHHLFQFFNPESLLLVVSLLFVSLTWAALLLSHSTENASSGIEWWVSNRTNDMKEKWKC